MGGWVCFGEGVYITYAGFFAELRNKAIADGKMTREELGI